MGRGYIDHKSIEDRINRIRSIITNYIDAYLEDPDSMGVQCGELLLRVENYGHVIPFLRRYACALRENPHSNEQEHGEPAD